MNNPAVRTFLSAILILLVMLLATGLLTYLIPNGDFDLASGTFTPLNTNGIPVTKLILAPLLVLLSDSGVLIISIILFLFVISGSIHVLKETQLIENGIHLVVNKFGKQETLLQGMLILFFMSLGAFIGVFEEIVPLVPLIILLSEKMGWDVMTGLGLSVLATGIGFACAITNPFTIGVAQQIAGVPLFSGAILRILVFISVYLVFFTYMTFRTKGLKATPMPLEKVEFSTHSQKALKFFALMMALMLLSIISTTFLPPLRDLSLPIIALIFLISAFGVGRIIKGEFKWTAVQFATGVKDMLPAVLLVLLASSIKYVMTEGNILGTILHYASQLMSETTPIQGLIYAYLLVMVLNFFIGSGSAKAFILMPILMPLMDLMGLGRQLGILAFQFGDGFSNVLYPTNAVLLIALGLSKVSYGKWLKFVLPIQGLLFLLSLTWLFIGYKAGYGL